MTGSLRREAAELRRQWLERALSTRPADRPAAEAAISGLYRLAGLDPPRFHWVSSPVIALETVPPGVPPRSRETIDRFAEWPVPPRLMALARRLREQLEGRASPALQPMQRVVEREITSCLLGSLRSTLVMALWAAHDSGPHPPQSLWYSTQNAFWVAGCDALRQMGVVFTAEQNRHLDLWATATTACGTWWPRERVCVVSERPVAVHTEVWGDGGEVRLHCADGPALRYADGWDLYAWHGTLVPAWVITDPSVRRIQRETNVEVRRCAIERIGWPSYIEQAGLHLLAVAPDPGNPGAHLHLYDMTEDTRVLLVVNGSVERDGHRRRYGLTVPGHFSDPIAAAGWTYGLTAEQYALLARRT